MRLLITFLIVNFFLINLTYSSNISNCSSCNDNDLSEAKVLESSKSDKEVCKFSKYSAAFKKEANKRGLDCKNLKNISNIFGKNLGKVKPQDPFFHLKRIKMTCENKKGNLSKKTLFAYSIDLSSVSQFNQVQ